MASVIASSARGRASMTDSPGKKVLVVTFRFPPHGGGGVHRATHFVNNLPEFGWRPHVLTGPGDGGRHVRDPSLLQLVEGVPVTRTGYVEVDKLYRALGRIRLATVGRMLTPWLPTVQAGWIPFGLRDGRRLLREERFDAILSSAYPMSSHLVAYGLHRISGIPWVADYRDEWSLREVVSWPTPLHRRLAGWIDRRITASADRVVTTSPAHTERFARAFSGPEEKYVTITNGFDSADFPDPDPGTGAGVAGDREDARFTVAHVGTVFSWRGADPFLEAVREVLDEGVIGPERLRVRFVGYAPDLGFDDLRSAGVLQVTGYVAHDEAVREMTGADLLLLINTERTNIPGKTFEYLGSGRPILAAVREGPTADLVRENGAGVVVGPEDTDAMARELRSAIEAWRRGRPETGARREEVVELTRHALTKRLARLLDEVSRSAPSLVGRDSPVL